MRGWSYILVSIVSVLILELNLLAQSRTKCVEVLGDAATQIHSSSNDALQRAFHFRTSAGHDIYTEVYGSGPRPVVFILGGPGSTLGRRWRSYFDPEKYTVYFYDPIGVGESRPLGPVEGADMLSLQIEFMEELRRSEGVNRWEVFGGSWGSTVSLAYAARHPDVIQRMVLRGIYLGRQEDLSRIFSDDYSPATRELLEPLRRQLQDYMIRQGDAREFGFDGVWERVQHLYRYGFEEHRDYAKQFVASWMQIANTGQAYEFPPLPWDELRDQSAEIFMHYATYQNEIAGQGSHFLRENEILQGASRIRASNIPVWVVHGEEDELTTINQAEALQRVLDPSGDSGRFVLMRVPGARHSDTEPGVRERLLQIMNSTD